MRLLVLFLCLGVTLLSQSFKPTYQTNPKLNLDTVLAGVRFIVFSTNEKNQKQVDEGEAKIVVEKVKIYSKFLGFDTVGFSTQEKENVNNLINSECDKIDLGVYLDHIDSSRSKLTLHFITCNNDYFVFETIFSDWENMKDEEELCTNFLYRWKQMYQRKKVFYDVKHRLSLPKLPTNWTEKTLKEYFNGPQVDSLEGIYEKMKLDIEDTESQYRIAVVKTDNLSYNVIYLSGAKYPDDWQEGEIKAVLNKSAVPNYYKVDWYMRAKALNKDVYLQRTPEGILEFMFPDKNPSSKWSYLKTYPVKW